MVSENVGGLEREKVKLPPTATMYTTYLGSYFSNLGLP